MKHCTSTHQKLLNVITESGIWQGSRNVSHRFLLSPSVYRITDAQRQELAKLGFAINDCLQGLSHIAAIAFDRHLNYRGPWLHARKLFSAGVPNVYLPLQGMNVRHVPRLLKVDLMVDCEGQFRIAEIDGHNKHGLGYSTLGLRFRDALYPNAERLPGAVAFLAKEMERIGHEELTIFYADQERFYIPEFQIAQKEFAKYGIRCTVVSEMNVDTAMLKNGLFLDLPFLYHRNDLYDIICPAYQSDQVKFIIPPKPFLGAKGALALLRNDTENAEIEALLRTFIRESSLTLVREYIPETILVGKQGVSRETVRQRVKEKRYVLKESISSGMKGTVFSDSANFEFVLARAYEANMNWILQAEVTNQPQSFSWFDPNETGDAILRTAEDWFMRVTVQYINRHLGDVIVTARRDKAVHGGKDCLQLGTIIAP